MGKRRILYAIIFIGIIILIFFYANYQFIMLFTILITIFLISYIIMILASCFVSCKIAISNKHISYGDCIGVQVKVIKPLLIGIANDRVLLNMSFNNDTDCKYYKINIAESNMYGNNTKIPMTHCGIAKIYIEKYECTDYTGAFKATRKIMEKNEYVVMPIKVDISKQLIKLASGLEDNVKLPGENSTDSEINDIRKFIPGDPMKMIHWKLSSRMQELYVKNMQSISDIDYRIIIDLHVSRGAKNYRSVLDRIYICAYSVAYEMIRCKCIVEFVVWNKAKHAEDLIRIEGIDDLEQGIIKLMRLECTNSAETLNQYAVDNSIYITSNDYINYNVCVIDVRKLEIGEIL